MLPVPTPRPANKNDGPLVATVIRREVAGASITQHVVRFESTVYAHFMPTLLKALPRARSSKELLGQHDEERKLHLFFYGDTDAPRLVRDVLVDLGINADVLTFHFPPGYETVCSMPSACPNQTNPLRWLCAA